MLLLMTAPDSPQDPGLDSAKMKRIRGLLKTPVDKDRAWPALCAAAFAASTALALATAMVIAPPVTTTHVVERQP